MPNEQTKFVSDDEDEIDPIALVRALREMGQRARQEAFAAGLSILVARGDRLLRLHPDGREVDCGPVEG